VGRKVGMEEQHQDRIADIAQRFGLTQDEARIFDHLVEATALYDALPDDYDKSMREWVHHQRAMVRMLMWRVVRRDHPEGWHTVGEEEDRRLTEGESDG
jgi:hypothetical protein